MRKNNALLAAAISATFVVSMNASYAGLVNHCADTAVCNAASTTSTSFGTEAATYALVPTDEDQGIIYATHLFGDTSSTLSFPSGENEYAAVVWNIEGTISGRLEMTALLDNGAQFSGTPLLIYNGNAGVGNLPLPSTESCNGSSSCKWRFGDNTTANITNFAHQDEFYILYKITSATNLGTDGSEVKMKVDFGTIDEKLSSQTITIAASQDPFTVRFEGTNNPYIKVAVALDNTGFITQRPADLPGSDEEWRGNNDVIFGYMKMTINDEVKASNGYTKWNLGNISDNSEFDAGHDAVEAVLTTLTISEEGQFAASLTGSNGEVYLYINTAEVAASSVTDTQAIWELSNANLMGIMTSGASFGDCTVDNSTDNNRCIPIGIKTDGTNQINIPAEDPPKAQLVLYYKTSTNKQEIKYPGDDDPEERLTIYTQDGISCWVFNVPYADAIDYMNLRIFNDSSTTALKSDGTIETECVHGTFYDVDGTASEKVALGCPPAGGVLYFNTANMAEKFSGFPTGTGRGTMFITSTLSKMEVLAMLRYKAPPCYAGAPCDQPEKSPLTNLSTGAHGVACAPDYR